MLFSSSAEDWQAPWVSRHCLMNTALWEVLHADSQAKCWRITSAKINVASWGVNKLGYWWWCPVSEAVSSGPLFPSLHPLSLSLWANTPPFTPLLPSRFFTVTQSYLPFFEDYKLVRICWLTMVLIWERNCPIHPVFKNTAKGQCSRS